MTSPIPSEWLALLLGDGAQPGAHIASHRPRSSLVRVLRKPYTGTPYSPGAKLLKRGILPALAVAVILAAVTAWQVASLV